MTEPPLSHTLNVDITLVELLQALKRLQKSKATSLDSMKVEFILDVGDLLHMPLLTTFNCFLWRVFYKPFPLRWSTRSLTGVMPSNLTIIGGITVGPILAKLFAMILDKRLSEWVKQHGLRAKG